MNPQLLISCVCGENLLYKNVQNVCCITVYKLYRKTAKKRLIKLVSKYFIFSRLSLKNIEHCTLVQDVPQINKNTAILKDGKLEKIFQLSLVKSVISLTHLLLVWCGSGSEGSKR